MGGEQSSQGNKKKGRFPTGSVTSDRASGVSPASRPASYSISKQIGDGAPFSQSPLSARKKIPQPQSTTNPKLKQIVVVNESLPKQIPDHALERLNALPVFLPIMKGSLNIPHMKDPDMLDKLDHRQVLLLCMRYQEHLRSCAEAVSFDQNALSTRIKEVDFAIKTIMSAISERQRKFRKYAEQMHKVSEISSVLTRIQIHLSRTVTTMDTLNRMLPNEDQLEPFQCDINSKLSTTVIPADKT